MKYIKRKEVCTFQYSRSISYILYKKNTFVRAYRQYKSTFDKLDQYLGKGKDTK